MYLLGGSLQEKGNRFLLSCPLSHLPPHFPLIPPTSLSVWQYSKQGRIYEFCQFCFEYWNRGQASSLSMHAYTIIENIELLQVPQGYPVLKFIFAELVHFPFGIISKKNLWKFMSLCLDTSHIRKCEIPDINRVSFHVGVFTN